MRIARGALALGAAALAQVLLSSYLPALARFCDLFTIVVVYYGLTSRPPAAMVMGTSAGLVEDSLLGAILGLNGFKKTLIAYLVGSAGSLFMLNQAIPRFGILFVASLLDPLAELALSVAMGQGFNFPGAWDLLRRGLGNGVFGLLFFWVAARLP
ncbi:MAG: rod shape-determining protein MreD [Acidobacteria bacterium]|nr:rod shape-determining protein MreD [Acidobacteriota bacterium]